MPVPAVYHEFAVDLARLASDENRAALAALRRGLGKQLGEANDSYRFLPRWLTSGSTYRQDACFLVATLFSLHQQGWTDDAGSTGATNLGASFGRLMRHEARESIEQRFVALLNCHVDDLPTHLRHAVSLLGSANVAIDWGQLLSDVEHWGSESHYVQRAWASAYWGSLTDSPGDSASNITNTPTPSAT